MAALVGADEPKKDDFTRTYKEPIAKVFIAVAQVAALHWNVTHSDKDTYTVSFRTGANMRTWKGFDVSAVCVERPDGSTTVSVHPQKREGDQLFSWKEGNRVASKFHEELKKRLQLSTEP